MSTSGKYFLMESFDELLKVANSISRDICEVICKNNQPKVIEGQCFQGTQRMTHIDYHHKKDTCEKELYYSYRKCGKEVKCKEVEVSLGDCIKDFRDVTTVWEEFNHTTLKCEEKKLVEHLGCGATEQCAEPIADIMFLLDSSGSITNADWNLQMKFVVTLMKQLKMGPNAIHTGVMAFATNVRTQYQLGGHTLTSTMEHKVQSMYHERGWTATGKGLNFVNQEFARRGRHNVNKILILMTDGESNDYQPGAKSRFKAIPEASSLQQNGVNIIVIGIGKATSNQKFVKELQAIATPPMTDNLFFVKDFDKLKDWAEKISKETCESITPPNPSLCDLPPKRTVSECFNGIQKITEIRYVWDAQGVCSKKLLSHTTNPCKMICEDPINGNEYLEGETWISDCNSFTCTRTSQNVYQTLIPKAEGCIDTNHNCYAAEANSQTSKVFTCKDEVGNAFDTCKCLQNGGANKAKYYIVTADAKRP